MTSNAEIEGYLESQLRRSLEPHPAHLVHGVGAHRPALDRFGAFSASLRGLCRLHGVMLGSSLYDPPAVYELTEGEDPIERGRLDNRLRNQ